MSFMDAKLKNRESATGQFESGHISVRSESAWTLVELVAVLATITVLIGLAIPAIFHIRESARIAVCRDRVRQLSLATINFESSHTRMPDAAWFPVIAGFLELNAKETLTSVASQQDSHLEAILYCPSETLPQQDENGAYSCFLGNNGVWSGKPELTGPIAFPVWVREEEQIIRMASVTDGTSNTVLFGEVLRGGPGRLRTIWQLPNQPYSLDQFEELVKACETLPKDPLAAGLIAGNPRIKGLMFVRNKDSRGNYSLSHNAGLGPSMYNHAALPQSPSCFNGQVVWEGLYSATSNHDGLNMAFCDGSARYTSKNISREVWRAWGSKAGGEINHQSF